MASSTDLDIDEALPTVDDLLREYDGWVKTSNYDDDFDLVAKTTALYRFAIKHHSDPGAELLLQAIAAFEAAEHEER